MNSVLGQKHKNNILISSCLFILIERQYNKKKKLHRPRLCENNNIILVFKISLNIFKERILFTLLTIDYPRVLTLGRSL